MLIICFSEKLKKFDSDLAGLILSSGGGKPIGFGLAGMAALRRSVSVLVFGAVGSAACWLGLAPGVK